MIKSTLFILIAIFFASCAQQKESKTQIQPNIVCVVAEDISPYIGCYGDKHAVTPNIDKLASEGIRFDMMFSVAGVCAPSRNALITGMYPTSIGGSNMRTRNDRKVLNVPDSLQIEPYECTPPPYVKCYTEYMRNAGYYCTNNVKTDYQFKAPKSAWDESSTKAHWRNRQDGQPFFAIFNFMRSHESQVWGLSGEPLVVNPDSIDIPSYFPNTKAVRDDFAQMYTNNTVMDREVGEVIAQLEEDGLLENTIVIFYSDHGGPMPRGKREAIESGTHVPFIIRFPNGKFANTIDSDLHSFIDVPETILSLVGIKIPDYMQGQAFLGDQKSEPLDYVYSGRDRMDEWFDCRRSVRDERYRYVKNYRPDLSAYLDLEFRKTMGTMKELIKLRDAGQLTEEQMYWFRNTKAPEELYDLENDPNELINLAALPEYSDILKRLQKEHEDWVIRIDDKGIKYKTEKALRQSMWPDDAQPLTIEPIISDDDNTIEMSCTTEGASIVYQINNAGHNKDHWFLYDKPFEIADGDTITALAHRIGFAESDRVNWINQ